MKVVVKTNFGTPSSRRALRMWTKVKTRVSRVSREQKTGVLWKKRCSLLHIGNKRDVHACLVGVDPWKCTFSHVSHVKQKSNFFPHTPQFKLHIIENTFTKAIRTFSDSFSKFSSSFVPENEIEICSTSEGYNWELRAKSFISSMKNLTFPYTTVNRALLPPKQAFRLGGVRWPSG